MSDINGFGCSGAKRRVWLRTSGVEEAKALGLQLQGGEPREFGERTARKGEKKKGVSKGWAFAK